MKIFCLVAALLLVAGPVVAGGVAEATDAFAGGLACDDLATAELEDCPLPVVVGSANSLFGGAASPLFAGGLAGGGAAVAVAAAVGAVLLISATSGVSSTN